MREEKGNAASGLVWDDCCGRTASEENAQKTYCFNVSIRTFSTIKQTKIVTIYKYIRAAATGPLIPAAGQLCRDGGQESKMNGNWEKKKRRIKPATALFQK